MALGSQENNIYDRYSNSSSQAVSTNFVFSFFQKMEVLCASE